MRFGHSLVPSVFLRRDAQCNFRRTSSSFGTAGKIGLRVCNTLLRGNDILMEPSPAPEFDPTSTEEYGHGVRDSIDEWMMGLSSGLSEREDILMTSDLRNFVFGPVSYNRRDLAALNIQRARDNGIPDYNTVRAAWGLPPAGSFANVTADPALQRRLEAAYGNSTRLIDLFVGGLAESDRETGNPGPLFSRILLEQFGRTRDGDRFWYANVANGLFTPSERASIENLTFRDLIVRNTNVPPGALQANVFRHRGGDPCPAPEEVGEEVLDACTPLSTHDFWTDASSAALPGTAMLFVSFFLLCIMGLAGFVLWQRRQARKLVEEIERSFSPPTHDFDSRVAPPHSNLSGRGPAGLLLTQQQQHLPPTTPAQMVTLAQPQPRAGRTGANVEAPTPASTPSVQRFREAEQFHRGNGVRTPQDLPASAITVSDLPSGLSAIPSEAASASASSPSQGASAAAAAASAVPNEYGAVLYSPAMGTASVFVEIQEHAVGAERGSAAAANAAPGRANIIHQGSTAGWLCVRSASGEQERLYHVPLSFVHSVVVMGERRRVRDGGLLPSEADLVTSSSQAAGGNGDPAVAGAAAAGPREPPKSPMSVVGFQSMSAMTRLNWELRSGAVDAFPIMASPAPFDGQPTNGQLQRTPMPSTSPVRSSTPANGAAGAPWPPLPTGAADQSSPRLRSDSGLWSEEATAAAYDESDQYAALRHRSVLLRVPKRYDVWLVFPDVAQRASFVLELQSACARVGGRQLQLGSANCLLVRQAVFSAALLNLDQASSIKTTRVRAAELQRFFQRLIAQSGAEAEGDAQGQGAQENKGAQAAAADANAAVAAPAPPAAAAAGGDHQRNGSISPAAFSRRAAEAVLPYSTPRRASLLTPRPTPRLRAPSESEAPTPRPLPSSSHASRPVQSLPLGPLHVDASSPRPVSAANTPAPGHGSMLAAPPQMPPHATSPSVAISRMGRSMTHAPDPAAVAASEPLYSALNSLQVSLEQAESLLDIEVTVEELASALELVPAHPFVRQLFNMADREGSGLCSFRGLEHILLTLSRGAQAQKLRLLFDLYDLNGSGLLEVEEITSMVRESLRVTDEYDSPDREARVEAEVAEALAAMYQKAGLLPGDQVDFASFQVMMTAQAQQPAQAGAAAGMATPAAELEHGGHGANESSVPPPGAASRGDEGKGADEGGAAGEKSSMLNRLLRRMQKPSRRSRNALAAAAPSPPAVAKHSVAAPPSGAGHKRGSSAAGNNSWSMSAAIGGVGELPMSPPNGHEHRHKRLDSHVVKTRERGTAGESSAAFATGTPGDDPELPSLLQQGTRRSLPMQLRTYINAHRAHIFVIVLFYLVCFGIFGERFWFFGYQIEHAGIRRIVQWSVPVTRGCASVIAFTMGVLLLTMCRNLLCYLQTTRAARFIPFQAAQGFHVLVAYTCGAFMLGHVIGHGFNWYQIATQPNVDTPCYLPDVAYPSNFLPSFVFWVYGTPTNMSGVILLLWMLFFYAVSMARQYLYNFFMHVHGKLFVVCYVLSVVHGMHQLFAYPLFWLFCIGPGILFILDRLWSFARVNAPLPVLAAQVLPSKVLKLTIAKPPHVTYSSGQFLRLASDFLRRDEWHPLSITSAPHQDHLSVHVRAVGPWTTRLFQLYHPMHLTRRPVTQDDAAPVVARKVGANGQQQLHAHGSAASLLSASGGAGLRSPLDPLSPFSPPVSAQSLSYLGRAPSMSFSSTMTPGANQRREVGAFMDKVPAGFVARASEFYLPPISVDGPFGGSHQGWSKFRTVVLIGGGIGITPFASILQDFMHQVQMERLQEKERERKLKKRMQHRRSSTAVGAAASAGASGGLTKKNAKGQRVPATPNTPADTTAQHQPSTANALAADTRPPMLMYFIWIGRSHMGYEWLIDLIREAESLDHATGRLHLQVQMYITTPPNQFDLRTAIDYAFERHFDRVNGCSLFTGLRSSIGWGRPDFTHLFELIAARHPAEDVGLFTCGSGPLLDTVQKACDHINAFKGSHFHHHAEQFQ